MIKSLQRMMLLVLLTVFGSAMVHAQENEVTWEAASNDALPNISVNDDINLTWLEASGDQAPFYSTRNGTRVINMKRGNKLTVAGASEDVTITEIVFNFHDENIGLTPSVGSNSNNYSSNTSTWTGEANSITFSAGSTRYIVSMEITYTGHAAPIVKAPVLAITQDGIANTYDMDANGVFVVYYENQGNLAAENAKLTLFVDGAENNAKEIGTLNFGANTQNFWNAKYNLTDIEAGEHQVYLAMTADNAETVQTETKTVTFTKKAAEATFSISAPAVTVAHDATSYAVVATLKNTSTEAAAANVKVELRQGFDHVLAQQAVEALAANAETQVTFTINQDLFETGTKTYNLYVNDKFLSTVEVTFEAAPVVDVKDLAITEVLGTIKLVETTNQVRVTVQNNGNVNITNAPVVLKSGDKTLGEGTISATAGNYGYTMITVSTDGLGAGELAVTATVTVENDATPADNTKDAILTVEAVPTAEATFTVTAENVTVAYGVTSFEIKAVVKNTSEVDATNVAVKLLSGITEVETQTISALTAGAEQEVTFTISATEEVPFVGGQTAIYYVQAPTAQAEVIVTFEEEEVKVIDMALTQIQGISEINLSNEENKVQVWYQNNGTVATTATIYASLNDIAIENKTVQNVKAGAQFYVEFTLPTEGLVAGETATFEANIICQGDNNAENNTVSKQLNIVSGEELPKADIALNPISSWEVEAGEQTVNISVGVFNNGDADAENVEINLYQSYPTILATKTISLQAGASTFVNFSFDYTFVQGKVYEFTVQTLIDDANMENNIQKFTLSCPTPVADVAVAKIGDINATTDEEVKINAVLKNNSDFAATEVKVGIFKQGQNYQYELVGIQRTIETIAAGATANVEFNLGQLEAGTYNYYVRVVTEDGNMNNNVQDVTIKVTEPVVPVVNIAMTAIQGISNIDLAAENNAITVWVNNEGNVTADAIVAVTINNTELTAQTVTVRAGSNAYASFTLPTEGLTAGSQATVVATVTVADNISETISMTKIYDVVDSSVATEPVFSVAAENVTVAYGATSFQIKAVVKNTSAINATSVPVKLMKGIHEVETQTIALAASAEQEVTFTVAEIGEAGTTATYYVQAPKAQAEVTVSFEAAPIIPEINVTLTQINLAGGHIDLALETNVATVWVENKGNVAADATVDFKFNGTALQAQTISVNAGTFGRADFVLPTDGLMVGEKATVEATITVAGNTNEVISQTKEYDIVNSSETTDPVFSVVAQNVSVPFGAASFEIKAVVKNTSEVDATNVAVKLLSGITGVETQTISALTAGTEQQVTFTISATEESPFVAGQTATYYVQTPTAQAEVIVTFEEEAVPEVIDLAITAISGTLSVETENNYLTVFVENKGNVNVTGATVKLTAGDVELGTATVSAKAGNNGFCSITVPATALQVESLEITATVEAAGDANAENNTLSKTFQIALPAAQVEITLADFTVGPDMTSFTIPVKVKNLRENFAAKNVKVMIYDNTKLIGQTTIETIEAGAEITAYVNVEVETAYTETTALQAWATGYSEFQLVTFNLLFDPNGINDVKTLKQNAAIYTLGGQKVNNMKKAGIYIVNGQKVVVK